MRPRLLAQSIVGVFAFVLFILVVAFLSISPQFAAPVQTGVPSTTTTTAPPTHLTKALVSQLAYTDKLCNVFLPNNPAQMRLLHDHLASPSSLTQLAVCALVSPTSGGGSRALQTSTRTLLPLYDYGQSGGWWCWAGNANVGLSFEVTRVELSSPGARGNQIAPGAACLYLVTLCITGEAWGGARRTEFEALGATCHQTGAESFVLTGKSTCTPLRLQLSALGEAHLVLSCTVAKDLVIRADVRVNAAAPLVQLDKASSTCQRWGGAAEASVSVVTSAQTWDFLGVPATLGGMAERRRWALDGWNALTHVSDRVLQREDKTRTLHLVLPAEDGVLLYVCVDGGGGAYSTVLSGPGRGSYRLSPLVEVLERDQAGVPLTCVYSDATGDEIRIHASDTTAFEHAVNATRRWVMRGEVSPAAGDRLGTLVWWDSAQTSPENIAILQLPEPYPSSALEPSQIAAYVFLLLFVSALFAYIIAQPIALAVQLSVRKK
jgi:hypothetical protein